VAEGRTLHESGHDDMDKTKWPAISGLVVGTILLSRSVPTTFAFDKPIHTSIVILASCAAAIIALSRFLPKDGGRSHKGQQYDAVPLNDIGRSHGSQEPSPSAEDVRYPSSLRRLRILFLTLVTTICLRVEVLREVLANTQCAGRSWEPLLPFAIAIVDWRTVQIHKKRVLSDDPDSSVYDELEVYLLRAPYRYVVAALVLGLVSMLALGTTGSPPSTYICAASLPFNWIVPNLQKFGTLLDLLIAYCVGQLLHQQDGRGARSISLRVISVGWAFLFSAMAIFIEGVVYYVVQETDRKWLLTIPRLYIWSVAWLNISVCFVAICTIMTVSAMHLSTPADSTN